MGLDYQLAAIDRALLNEGTDKAMDVVIVGRTDQQSLLYARTHHNGGFAWNFTNA